MTYTTETERAGHTFRVAVTHDDCMSEPWKEHGGHGPVSDWERRAKRPGEVVLLKDRQHAVYYDFAAAVRLAKKEGWGGRGRTKGERAAAAARADYEYLRAWCENEWHWCCVNVTLLDDDGEDTDISASLGGVESFDSYVREIESELISECLRMAEARTYPVTECGV